MWVLVYPGGAPADMHALPNQATEPLQECVKTAELAGRLVPIGNDNGKREALLMRLRAVSPNQALIEAVALGVAFHTSGETPFLAFLLSCLAVLHSQTRLFL